MMNRKGFEGSRRCLYFKVLYRYSPRGTDEDHEITYSGYRSLVRDFNPGSSEYEAGVLTTRQRRSVARYSNRKIQ
jgi:hypothetical protein